MARLFSCRHLPILLSCLLLAACSCAARTRLPAPPDPARVAAEPDVKRLSAADTDFGFRLLHQLRLNQPSGNVFFSPFSISEALLLTMNGAAFATGAGFQRVW